ncbi:spore germination protein [Paenibacillus sp. IB182496]|uniref:Spore germination protein n=1 Tax=Paenibacillus sabuli TaxID=2772509 RepID=A0A927GTG5_9BACL|nr:spore germination protein [Paenibacillus sabuli]MBD2846707.1 spore germination protein [Paenibacillus sabuli]
MSVTGSHQTGLPLAQHPTSIAAQLKARLPADDLTILPIDDERVQCLFFTTLIDQKRYHREIVPHLQAWAREPEQWRALFPQSKRLDQLEAAVDELLHGSVLLLGAGDPGHALAIPLRNIQHRSIQEPSVEKNVIGAKESFTEDFEINIGLLRRWVKDPQLDVRCYEVGRRSRSKVGVVYQADIARPDYVDKIVERIEAIDIDALHAHRELMDMLIDRRVTPFPLYEMTEIPSKAAAGLAKGRIAVFFEGSPFAVMLPTVMMTMIDGPENMLQGILVPGFVKAIRIVAQLLALYAAPLYLAIVTVDSFILPTEFGLTIASDQSGLPYAPVVEVVLFMIILDIFIEGTSYVAGNIGPAINVFGSLVIGEAATQTGLMSRMMMIITAITVIGTYLASYQLSYAVRVWKYPLIAAASIMGLYGIMLLSVGLLSHLCSLQSLGVPYMSPLAPLRLSDLFGREVIMSSTRDASLRTGIYAPQDRGRQPGGGGGAQ